MLPCFPFHIGFSYHTDETLHHAKFNGTHFQNRIHSRITQEHLKNTAQIRVSWFCSSTQKYLNTSNRFFRHNHLKKLFAIITITLWDPILKFLYVYWNRFNSHSKCIFSSSVSWMLSPSVSKTEQGELEKEAPVNKQGL